MKIKKVQFVNNDIFGNLVFDFCDSNGNVFDNIILAGENGTGKSTLENYIYEFSILSTNHVIRDEKRIFVITLNSEETKIVKEKVPETKDFSEILDLSIELDYSKQGWNAYTGNVLDTNDFKEISIHNGHINNIRKVFRTLFSDIEVNFNPRPIESVKSSVLDMDLDNSIKSHGDLATQISQLLVDIQMSDDSKVANYVRENLGQPLSLDSLDLKMNRFIKAFEFMFPTKKYSGIRDMDNSKKIIFKEFDKEIPLEKLSSGEKQIVFRGGFLLKDQQSTKDALVIIDEPEISLHPSWQQKILQYYKKLFTNISGKQTSQLIISTHSPFIIHNNDMLNTKIIILKHDETGNINTPQQKNFYNWTEEQAISEAFNIEMLSREIEKGAKNLIVTEGKTDWKHLKRALDKFKFEDGLYIEDNFGFLEYEDEFPMGSKNLISFCEQYSKTYHGKKIICIFDRDEPDVLKKVTENEGHDYKHWGNQVYSFAILYPEHRKEIDKGICIEHYYSDEEIKMVDNQGFRLFLANEFSNKSGVHSTKQFVCQKKNKCGPNSIAIIDRDSFVFPINDEDKNIALSKNDFAENIINEKEPFDKINYKNFGIIFDKINEILAE